MVSVITAFYNAEEFLRATVESVASQTLQPEAHIIIDDCSTDGSLCLAKELARKYPHVRLIKHDFNQGYPSALNTGIAATQSDYIAILDSDDIALPNWLETVVPVLDANPDVGSVGGGCVIMTESAEVTGYAQYCGVQGDITERILEGEYLILHPGTIHRKSVITSVGGYNPLLRSLEDNDIFLGIASLTKILSVGVPLIYYRQLRSSESGKSPEFAILARRILDTKARLLRNGATIAEANASLTPMVQELQTVPRLAQKAGGTYELAMGFAFESGGKRKRALDFYLSAIVKGSSLEYPIAGLLRCTLPKIIYIFVKEVFNWSKNIIKRRF